MRPRALLLRRLFLALSLPLSAALSTLTYRTLSHGLKHTQNKNRIRWDEGATASEDDDIVVERQRQACTDAAGEKTLFFFDASEKEAADLRRSCCCRPCRRPPQRCVQGRRTVRGSLTMFCWVQETGGPRKKMKRL